MKKIIFTNDELQTIRACAEELGIPYSALKQATAAYLAKCEQNRAAELSRVKNIAELDKSELWRLRQNCCLNSLYISDYVNDFGINPSILCDIFDGYTDELRYIANGYNEDGGIDWDEPEKIFAHDNAENLHEYIYGIEWDSEYLEQMTTAAKAEINDKYDELRDAIFEQEEIYYIGAKLQYKAVA